jgi:GT2 family glycosyltransferase
LGLNFDGGLRLLFSIVVPTFNGGELLRSCLKSITKLDFPKQDFEVIVVDNNSTDNTKAIIAEFPFKYVMENRFQSSYAARNAGVAVARGQIFAFTDSDCEVDKDWLTHILEASRRNPKAGCIAGEILPFPASSVVERFSDKIGLLRQRGPLSGWHFKPYAQTANAAYRREVFDKVGLFDGHMKSGGDATFAWRMLAGSDYEITFAEKAVVYHHHRTDVTALWSQFRRYGGGKVSWIQQEKTYPPPKITDQEAELIKAVDVCLASMQKAGLNEDEFIFPLLNIATKAAHHSGFLQDMLKHVTGEEASNKWPLLAAAAGNGAKAGEASTTTTIRCTICRGTVFLPGPNNRLVDGKGPACKTCSSLERHRALHTLAPLFIRRGSATWKVLTAGENPPSNGVPFPAPQVVRSLDPDVTAVFNAIFAFARPTGTGGSLEKEIEYYSDRLAPDGLLAFVFGLAPLPAVSSKRGPDQFVLGADAGWQVVRSLPEHGVLQCGITDEVTGASVRMVFASRDSRLLDEIAGFVENGKGAATFVAR